MPLKNKSVLMTLGEMGLHPGGRGTSEVLEALLSCPVTEYLTCTRI